MARAADSVLVRFPDDDEGRRLAWRIAAELTAAGLTTRTEPEDPSRSGSLVSDGPRSSVSLLVRLRRTDLQWTAAMVTPDGTVVVSVRADRRQDPAQLHDLLALRVVEGVRAAFVKSRPAPEQTDPPLTEGPAPDPGPALGWVAGSIRIGATPTGGLSPLLGPDLRVGFAPRRGHLTLELDGFASGLEGVVSDSRGTTRVGVAWLRGRLGGRWWFARRWTASVFGAGGVALAWARGRAQSPNQDRNDLAIGGTVGGGAELRVDLLPRLFLTATAEVGLLLPAVEIAFDEDVVARLGTPLVSGGVGVGYAWR
jgi:hypothetical protein